MDVEPLKRYGLPHYPTRLRVLAEPELLRKHVPLPWRKCAEVAGAAAAFLAASGLAWADEGAGPKNLAQAAIVAPVFEHGEGRGVTGCVVHSPPVFLSEEEALQVIREALAQQGVSLTEAAAELGDVVIVPRTRLYKKVGEKYVSEVVEAKDKARPLRLDGRDPQRKIGVEFVSSSDYFELGGVHSASTVQDYNFKEVAGRLAKQVEGKAKGLYVGVFYDPAARADLQKMFRDDAEYQKLTAKRGAERTPEVQRQIRERASGIYKAWHEAGVAQGRKLLQQQVSDFVDWLKAQGAI